MKLLIAGSTSYLGQFFVRRAIAGNCRILALTRKAGPGPFSPAYQEIEISPDCEFDSRPLIRFAPDAIVHFATLNSSRCELDSAQARLVNVDYTRRLSELAYECRNPLLFTSTDLVFDGARPPPGGFTEQDEPAPRSVYARTKFEGEIAALAAADNIVVRLSLMYGPPVSDRSGPLGWMLDSFSSGTPLTLFSDEWRTPMYADDAARALIEILTNNVRGILHLGGPERISRVEFGRAVASNFDFDEGLIRMAKRADVASIPVRPEDVSLNSSRAYSLLSFRPAALCEGLARMRPQKG